MRNATIVESNIEPSKENLWLYKGELRQFGPNGWEAVSASDNAPKYIFKVIRDFTVLPISPSNPERRVKVYSYTEQDGVKKTFPITVYCASGGIVTTNLKYVSTGQFLVTLLTLGTDGNDLVIIEGQDNRQIIIPVTVSGYSEEGTTSTKPPVSTTTTTTTSTTTLYVKFPSRTVYIHNYTKDDDLGFGITDKFDSMGMYELNNLPSEDSLSCSYLSRYLVVSRYNYDGTIVAVINHGNKDYYSLYPAKSTGDGIDMAFYFDLSGCENYITDSYFNIKLYEYTEDIVSILPPFTDGFPPITSSE